MTELDCSAIFGWRHRICSECPDFRTDRCEYKDVHPSARVCKWSGLMEMPLSMRMEMEKKHGRKKP
jgi:hypothetical protein